MPVLLAETNIRGTVRDRITWLRFMQEQTHLLMRKGADVKGFCRYPSIDSTDWANLCTSCTSKVDPQGIWRLSNRDNRWKRRPSELSKLYAMLAKGAVSAEALPAYPFSPSLDHDLSGYVKLMRHWNWSGSVEERAA